MVINLLAFEKLANDDKAVFDLKKNEVKQAFQYLRSNRVAVNYIKDYKVLFETLEDTQAFDLRYKSLILQKINQSTLDGKMPTRQELDTLAAGFGKYIKSKEVLLTLKNYTHELAVAAQNDVSKEFIKETVNEAVREIKTSNPGISMAQEEAVQARITKVVNLKLKGEEAEPENEIEYKTDSDKIKEDFDKTKKVKTWAKNNNLEFTKEELKELKKGYNDEIVDRVIAKKEADINECNKVISEYFEKNVSRVSDTSFEKDLIAYINKPKESADDSYYSEVFNTDSIGGAGQSQIYTKYSQEINNLIKERANRFKENYIEEGLRDELANQEKIAEQKTQEFIDNDYESKIPNYTNIKRKDILDSMGRSNPDIQPYLDNENSTFPAGMSQEGINLLQSKRFVAKKYSNIVYDFYHPNLINSLGYGHSLKSRLNQYEQIKSFAGENKIFLPHNKQCMDLDKFYTLLRKSPNLIGQLNAGQRIAQLYKRFDMFSFGMLTRTGQAKRWVGFSRKWFGESSGDFTEMWLNNKIKGRTKQTIEEGLGKFVATAGERFGGDGIVWNIRKKVFERLKGFGKEVFEKIGGLRKKVLDGLKDLGQKALVALGKTVLGKAIKAIIGAVGGAFTGGVVPVVMGAVNLFKKYISARNKLLKTIGINMGALKRWADQTFGSGARKLMGVGLFLLEIPLMIMTMVAGMLSIITIVVAGVLLGILIYQFTMTGYVSSLVPPQFYDVMEQVGVKKGGGIGTSYENHCYVDRGYAKFWLLPKDESWKDTDICGTSELNQSCKDKSTVQTLRFVGNYPNNYCNTIPEQCYLETHVVDMYYQLLNAVAREPNANFLLPKLKVDWGYRDFEGQVEMWKMYCKDKDGNVVDYMTACQPGGGKCPGGRAACPGTSSHQTGRAIDFAFDKSSEPVYEWLVLNAGKFGFKKCLDISSCNVDEPWHWEYSMENNGGETEICEETGLPGMEPAIPTPPMP